MTGIASACTRAARPLLAALVALLLLDGAARAKGLADPREAVAIFQQATAAGDLEAIMALYAPNAVLLFPGAPVIGGSDKIRAVYQRNFAAGPNKLTIHAAQIDGDADAAVILWVWTFEVTPAEGQPLRRTGRSLVFFKRGPEGWLIYADMLQDAPVE
jgi:uncharacterized protein (TIGR02246 family)